MCNGLSFAQLLKAALGLEESDSLNWQTVCRRRSQVHANLPGVFHSCKFMSPLGVED